ncbi:MAG TPA: hypothetical protein VHW01_03365 [Polyangiaceae bacterium]|nr:hypothetical protein [Polyangiaceae bacterium]
MLACLGGACLAPKYDIDPTIDDLGAGAGGTAGASVSGSAGATTHKGGASSSGAGTSAGGTASAGAPASGKAGAAAGGKGGASGTAGAGGASNNGGAASAGAPAAGAAGNSAAGGSINCPAETSGATMKAAADTASTALVLLDDVVIHDATGTKILSQWQFAEASAIADTTDDPRPADKWSRSQYFGDPKKISRAANAHSTFLPCDGNPDVGSLKNTVPFTTDSQYYEASVLFAVHDYSGATISAKVKLVTGGAEDVTCAAHALLYAVSGSTETPNAPITLTEGVWKDLTLLVPATGFSAVGELGVRITTYPCL